ncbi:Mad3/BUB1 homology region 1-domain-containing protein, partial [Schizophyllum fasciatum]
MGAGPEARKAELAKLRQRLASPDGALDPIGVYDDFVKWTTSNYDENDTNSGLREILQEATEKFKKDDISKVDMRYVKFWRTYARLQPRAQAITTYETMMTHGIGTVFSPVYQEAAMLYEQDGRLDDADTLYRKGIKRQARPLDWLRTQYKEFRRRNGRSARKSSSSSAPSSSSAAPQKASSSSTSSSSVAVRSTAAQRYAVMLEPNPPGKRPEKFMFNFALLWTDDGGEFNIQEARARSMGLLDKKWNPPPASESRLAPGNMPGHSESTGMHTTRTLKRKSIMGGGPEPTMTINTKEALADVFGMYNSPERTMRHAQVAGGKHAPLMK